MKAKIPAALREQVWRQAFGEKFFMNKCSVTWCETRISPFDFVAGHNIPESKGGTMDLNNLKPICARCVRRVSTRSFLAHTRLRRCNLSMGDRYTIDEFSRLSNPAENPWACFRFCGGK